MMIADVIRQAQTEHEINFLLTAYFEATQFGGEKNFTSTTTIMLPLTGKDDLQKRFDLLVADLDKASKALDDNACLPIKETLHVLGNALHQLHHLELLREMKNHSLAGNGRNGKENDRCHASQVF